MIFNLDINLINIKYAYQKQKTIMTTNEVTNEEVEITPKQYNDILDIQQQILNMIAGPHHTKDALNLLCNLAESLLPNSVASVMLLDPETKLLSVRCAPSVPQVGHDALANLRPGPTGGSCGNAVYRNEPQFVQNTFEDKRWDDLRKVAYDFNLCSCWSMPVRDKNRNPIGSFALSSFEHRAPSAFHKKLLEVGSSIVTIILKNQHNEERLNLNSQAIESASDGMIITDYNNKVVEVNQSFEEIYGYTFEDLKDKDPNFLSSDNHDKKYYKKMWKEINSTDKWSGEIVNKKKNGELITQWMSISVLRDEDKNIKNYLAVFTDLTQLKEAQEKSEYLAFHDPLTGLKNKSYFEKTIGSKKDKTVILLNVNNFSYINTAYGFDIGDLLLKKLAKILCKRCDADNIFRFNSDEFALLFKKEINIKEKISEIQKYFFNKSIDIEDIKINVSFSFGAVRAKKNLLRKSSSALKKAKELGKNRYYIFEDNDIDYSHREEFIDATNLIRNAIDEDLIVPYFQGIYDNKQEKIEKYEALVRIEKDNEIISPYVFLEPARLSGLLTEITKIMIDKTLNVMTKNNYSFSINVTEEDLSQNYLVEYFKTKLEEYKVNPKRITLEILEGISSHGKKNHIRQLSVLKELGLHIAIDDFGREYSNFERIIDLDIDFIKIDAKYIRDIHTNKKSYEITKALSFFAKNANISCVAEFVHCKEVQEIIQDLGIDFSQGYYFSEPTKDIQ